jgi:hypothetical protein
LESRSAIIGSPGSNSLSKDAATEIGGDLPMKYTQRIFLMSLIVAVVATLLAYVLELLWLGAMTAVGLGLLNWFSQYKQKWFWSTHLFLIGIGVLVIFGVLLGLRLYFLLPAILGALAAWDLARFQQRINETQRSAPPKTIEKRHIGLLLLALGIGGILSSMVLVTQVQISFGITLTLGVILVISLGQIYRILRN